MLLKNFGQVEKLQNSSKFRFLHDHVAKYYLYHDFVSQNMWYYLQDLNIRMQPKGFHLRICV
jgi:hypothetical protein